MTKRLLNTQQVAELLNMSAATLISWRSKGESKLKFYKLGRRVLYAEQEVENWLKTKQSTATQPTSYF